MRQYAAEDAIAAMRLYLGARDMTHRAAPPPGPLAPHLLPKVRRRKLDPGLKAAKHHPVCHISIVKRG